MYISLFTPASGKKTLGHSNLKLILSWTMIAWQLPSRDNMQDGCPWWIHPGSATQSNFWGLANKRCKHFPAEKQRQELWLLWVLYASAEGKINRMILIWHKYLHKFSGVEFWIANCCTQCATIYDGCPKGDGFCWAWWPILLLLFSLTNPDTRAKYSI